MGATTRYWSDAAEPEYVNHGGYANFASAERTTVFDRWYSRLPRRQDRTEPAHERDAGGDCACALQIVVRGFRSGARQKGRWRKGESLPGLPAHLYDLFPDSFENSELGEIPKGWRVGTLQDIGKNVGESVRPSAIGPETPYIALEHMPRRSI